MNVESLTSNINKIAKEHSQSPYHIMHQACITLKDNNKLIYAIIYYEDAGDNYFETIYLKSHTVGAIKLYNNWQNVDLAGGELDMRVRNAKSNKGVVDLAKFILEDMFNPEINDKELSSHETNEGLELC